MTSAYVTFELDRVYDNEVVLRAPAPAKDLGEAAGAAFGCVVKSGPGAPPPAYPIAEAHFKIAGVFDGTNIVRLVAITNGEFDQVKMSQQVARFAPHKAFSRAADEALGLS